MTISEMMKIERTIRLRAPRSRVWRAITTPAEFSKWFRVEIDGKFEPGSRVQMISTYKGYEGIKWFIDIDHMEPEHTFSWRWYPGADPDLNEPMTLVEFRLEEAGQETIVTVVESGFDKLSLARRAKAFPENTQGWEAQIENLAKYVNQSV